MMIRLMFTKGEATVKRHTIHLVQDSFFCEHGSNWDCVKGGKFLEQLNEKISHPRSCSYVYLLCHIREFFMLTSYFIFYKQVVPALNQELRLAGICCSGGILPCILNLGSLWMWVFSFIPRPLYRRDKGFSTRLWSGWAPGLFWTLWKTENLCLCR